MGRQLAVTVEPLDAHLDDRLTELAELAARPLADRIEELPLTRYGELRASMCDELPESIEVRHGARSYRVVPLVQVELTEPRAAALLRRYRSRSAGSPAAR
ncbi:hypothetical protein [Micromonospora endophytica]|uniref:hypothetical protein n=1 Tax=Micromonospora endophytica TaxID=515350 RepID=UPI0015E8D6D4|nr:hypothetical protein [Micromonospora endophytica]BCJ60238.1 hypothetical protein Jiend_36600 [Micromonospora endophytica]